MTLTFTTSLQDREGALRVLKSGDYASALHNIDALVRDALKHGTYDEKTVELLQNIREEIVGAYDPTVGH